MKENEAEAVQCLSPGCDWPAKTRGLCQSCYSAARLRVASKVSSWEELEQAGLVLPSTTAPNAFKKALDRQLGVEEVARRRNTQAAAETRTPVEREVNLPPTIDEIRALAQKVAANPSAESMQQLTEMQSRMQVHQGEAPPKSKFEDRPSQLQLSQNRAPSKHHQKNYDAIEEDAWGPRSKEEIRFKGVPLVVEETLDRPATAESEEQPALRPLPQGVSEAACKASLPIPTIMEPAEFNKNAAVELKAKKMSLRERSFADARALAAGQPTRVVEEEHEVDGMSDEEFERIKQAAAVREAENVKQTPPITSADPGSMLPDPLPDPLPQASVPAPQFAAPALPEDVKYDSALDGPSEGVSEGFVPVNPVN